MSTSISERQLVWQPPESGVPAHAYTRFNEIVQQWVGTPYRGGDQCPGMGVDCVRFVEAVLGEAYRIEEPPDPELLKIAQDASMHDERLVTEVMYKLLRRYPHKIERKTNNVFPGDVVICKVGKGPGHTVIIGIEPWTCFHAMPTAGVDQGGVGSIPDVAHVIHLLEKERWA